MVASVLHPRAAELRGPIYEVLRIPMSYEEWLDWNPEGVRSEWVDGEAVVFVSSLWRHVEFTDFLTELLRRFLRRTELGRAFSTEFQMHLPDGSGRLPDVFVVLRRNLDRVSSRGLEGPADLAIEIVSKDSVKRDRMEKLRAYEAAGVPEYVMIESREGYIGFSFYRLDGSGHYQPVEPDEHGRYHSSVLPGLWFEATWFEGEDPPDPDPILAEMLSVLSLEHGKGAPIRPPGGR